MLVGRVGSLPVLIYSFDRQTVASAGDSGRLKLESNESVLTAFASRLDWVTMELATLEELMQIGWHKQSFLGKYILLTTPGSVKILRKMIN